MGIESDQLVYDYLSRVGDLAQQQQLSSGARMRLVSTLRGEIERRRAKGGPDTEAVVRRIIGRLGTPDELVALAARSSDGSVPLPPPREAEETGTEPKAARQRGVPRPRRGLLRKDTSRNGASDSGGGPADGGEEPTDHARPVTGTAHEEPVTGWPAASAPHMAGLDQAPATGEPDWWRIDPGPFGGEGVGVPGFVGGLEIPELLRPPVVEGAEADAAEEADEDAGEDAGETEAAPRARRPRIRLRLRRKAAEDGPARPSHPFLLLAAALLVAGAVLGSWLALAGGWLLAYGSRKLSRAEAKWVALGLPGAVVAGAFVWLWGRMDGRWGTPIGEDAMGDAMTDAWPVIVRLAAVASALYLVWRARRR